MNHPFIRIMGAAGAPARQENQDCQKEPAPPLRSTAPKESKYLRFDLAGIPQVLRDHPHWLVSGRSGRPVRRPGVGDSMTTPSHCADFAKVSQIVSGNPELWPYIVLTADSPFTVFDVDFKPRRESETPAQYEARLERAEKALGRLREHFPARYESRSKSGNGFHIIVRGKFDGPGGSGKEGGEWAEVEIYTKGRGIALTGHVSPDFDNPAAYPAEKIQALRDEIKGEAPGAENWEDIPDRGSHGSVSPGWARQVLAELERLHGRPGRDAWRDMSSAVFDGVGVETGIELLEEVWPEEKRGEYRELARTLPKFIPWGTLRGYGVNPDDPEELLFLMPDMTAEEGATKPARKRLADFIVNHSDTLGMSWKEIDALRPPFIIEGFLRRGEVLLLGAESKSRKSWLTQDAGFAVAGGLPWLADVTGANGFTTAQARVHVFDLELNPGEMRYRFAKARGNRFAADQGQAAAVTANVKSYSFDGQNMKEILGCLDELKSSAEPGDLVVVDCLYRLVPDGNEVKEVAEILETVKRFASDTMAGVIVVDHFRKAGDDKARNRFAGSFVKQASASTLVAVEVTAADVLVLNIDARTFHGCPKVHARFNPETYAFNRLPDDEVEKAKKESKRSEAEGWILRLWNGYPADFTMTAAAAAKQWGIQRQAATPRLGKLVGRGWLSEKKGGVGKATEWTLAPDGVAVVTNEPDDI